MCIRDSLGAEEMSDESDKTEKLGKAEGYVAVSYTHLVIVNVIWQ